MKKGKAITLLSIISVLMAALLVMTFVRFSYGIYDYNSILGAVDLDYDIEGGTAYPLTLADDNEEDEIDIDEVMHTLSDRLNALGYKSYKITALNSTEEGIDDYSIRIETKTTDSLASDIAAVTAYGEIKFFGGTSSDPTEEIMNEEPAIRDSQYVGSYVDGETTIYQVSVVFTDYGYNTLVDAIEAASSSEDGESSSSGYYLKITLGDNTILNAQITTASIVDKTVYIQTQSESNARQTALQIRTGGLAYKYDLSDPEVITPLFGTNTATYLFISVAVFAVLAMLVFILLFKGYGIIAALSFILFFLIEIAMLVAVPGIVLSVPGVIGIIFAAVICIDGLAMTISRIREEFAGGKTVKAAVKAGDRRAFRPILNVHVISGVVAILLFAFTGGALQCFAITFGIGVVVSFIADAVFTRMFLSLILPLTKNPERFFTLKRAEV